MYPWINTVLLVQRKMVVSDVAREMNSVWYHKLFGNMYNFLWQTVDETFIEEEKKLYTVEKLVKNLTKNIGSFLEQNQVCARNHIERPGERSMVEIVI